MDVGIDPFILYCLLIPGCSQGMALPQQGSGFTTSHEADLPPGQEKEL